MNETTEGEPTARRRRRAVWGWPIAGLAAGALLACAVIGTRMEVAQALDASPPAPYPTTKVFRGNQTAIGQTIAYPAGTPMVEAIVITVPPGVEYGWHTHGAPLFGYILEGELTVDYGSKGVRVFRAGEAMLEAVDWPHRPSNRGAVVTRVLAVNIGAEGGPLAVPAGGP
ncbi:MAG: cupin domain-containing protein [Parvibaculaceae bacterium]